MMRSTPSTSGSLGRPDSQVLDVARREERVVVTADLGYPRLLALCQGDRPDIVLFRGGTYSDAEMLALLDRVLTQIPAQDLGHSIVVVDRQRIRRRALPVHE